MVFLLFRQTQKLQDKKREKSETKNGGEMGHRRGQRSNEANVKHCGFMPLEKPFGWCCVRVVWLVVLVRHRFLIILNS